MFRRDFIGIAARVTVGTAAIAVPRFDSDSVKHGATKSQEIPEWADVELMLGEESISSIERDQDSSYLVEAYRDGEGVTVNVYEDKVRESNLLTGYTFEFTDVSFIDEGIRIKYAESGNRIYVGEDIS